MTQQQMENETTESEQHTNGFFTRIGSWFKRGGNGAVEGEVIDHPNANTAIQTRTSFLRPWARRDIAINQLQQGFTTLTDLICTVRDNLEQQNKRQAELLNYL